MQADIESPLGWAAPVFAALGDELRMRLVAKLCEGGPASISRLADGAGITRQGVAKHLRVLETAGVVTGERRGREQVWQVRPARILDARRTLDRIALQWEGALRNLKVHIEAGG
jgi:DNA-binding transcriptional ArsR family regulator